MDYPDHFALSMPEPSSRMLVQTVDGVETKLLCVCLYMYQLTEQ